MQPFHYFLPCVAWTQAVAAHSYLSIDTPNDHRNSYILPTYEIGKIAVQRLQLPVALPLIPLFVNAPLSVRVLQQLYVFNGIPSPAPSGSILGQIGTIVFTNQTEVKFDRDFWCVNSASSLHNNYAIQTGESDSTRQQSCHLYKSAHHLSTFSGILWSSDDKNDDADAVYRAAADAACNKRALFCNPYIFDCVDSCWPPWRITFRLADEDGDFFVTPKGQILTLKTINFSTRKNLLVQLKVIVELFVDLSLCDLYPLTICRVPQFDAEGKAVAPPFQASIVVARDITRVDLVGISGCAPPPDGQRGAFVPTCFIAGIPTIKYVTYQPHRCNGDLLAVAAEIKAEQNVAGPTKILFFVDGVLVEQSLGYRMTDNGKIVKVAPIMNDDEKLLTVVAYNSLAKDALGIKLKCINN